MNQQTPGTLGAPNPEEEARRQHVLQLGELQKGRSADDEVSAITALVAALGDESWRVRKAAEDSLLRHHPHPLIVPTLVRSLASDDNAGLRNASAEALVRIGTDAVAELVATFTSPDVDLQKFAIDVAGEIGSTQAVEPLIARLDDADENVRAAAAEALGKIGSLQAIDALWKKALGGNDLLCRLSSLEALGKLEAAGPFEQLVELTKNRFLAKAAHGLLAVCPDPRAIDALVVGLATNPRTQRTAALLAIDKRLLQSTDGERALVRDAIAENKAGAMLALGELLQSMDNAVVAAAMRVLGASGEAGSAKLILDALRAPELREAAVASIAELGVDATPHIAEALGTVVGPARELAAALLAERGDARAIRMLIDGVLDADAAVREGAAPVLRRVAQQRASAPKVITEALEALSRADDDALAVLEDVLQEATVATPAEARPLLLHRLTSVDLKPRQLAIVWGALAGIVTDADLAQLLAATKDEREAVRAAAALGLSRLKSEEARRALMLCLSDESARVRKVVASRLGAFTEDAVRNALVVATNDADADVAATATLGLGRFDAAVVRPHLTRLLNTERTQVVIAALSALASSDPGALLELLPRLLEHAEVEVVKETVRVVFSRNIEAALPHAARLLNHAQWDVRYMAVTTFGRLPALREALRQRLAVEEDAMVKTSLEEVLG